MKRLALLFSLVCLSFCLFAQVELEKNILPLNLDGSVSIAQFQPLINDMGAYKIVGLGEGTHGTREFGEIRIALIKELIEKKGFRVICFENAFGDSYYFNQWLNSGESVKEGMKKYLIALWQTRELEEFFEWVRTFNKNNSEKVSIAGMDFNYLANMAKVIGSESKKLHLEQLNLLSGDLYKDALYFDSVWDNQMKIENRNDFGTKIRSIRSKLLQIDSIIKTNNLPVSNLLQSALLNGKCWGSGGGRDKGMALMAVNLAENNKMIVWAHAVHLALQSPYKNNMVGGCGGHIKQLVTDYYALGMGTANGKYAGTKDRFDTRINIMNTYKLPATKKNSWDDYFVQMNMPSFFIDLRNSKAENTSLPLRQVGYGPPQRISYTDEVKLPALFDGYIFIKNTNAPEYLR
ncbi:MULTISPECIES: erythromycin esterase family protein [Niastella]|uniref:Erythromycin esterase family protein n=1 Tax=Niastella soli TaxID=2821487 RepID=A0ABS3Z2D7_9BACT|nr:erythromycin esterase family protein [Niastella soli]MBO9204331.1 erythromycin esterase family protein [Niastella soli]